MCGTQGRCARAGRWSLRSGFWVCGLMLMGALAGCVGVNDGDPQDDDPSVAIAREIEEADIVKLIDGYFYISNPYTGLRIIDATDIDAPVLGGSYAVTGRGVELIVRDNYVLIFTSADFGYCAGEPVDFDDPVFGDVTSPEYDGTRLWVIDATDKNDLSLVSTVNFDGYVVGTRRVGDILYAAGNIGASTFVASIDITDPANIDVVQNLRMSGDADDIHVSQDAIYLFGDDSTAIGTTRVNYIDITDTNGVIAQRDSFRVPGHVDNRYFMDADGDTFRIVTEELDYNTFRRKIALYTYDVSDPDNVTRLAELPIVTGESLRAVRFDGTRGYAVTFDVIDPLFVLDLADPADPKVTGDLEVPGYSTHLVPLGDRLIGVGFASGSGFTPAVSLYDVSDPANPRQLSRVVISGFDRYGASSEATVDEKALGVLPDAGLVLLPYAVYDRTTGDFVDGLQLIEMSANKLTERGTIEHEGIVRRSGITDDRLWLLSDLSFATVDVDNLAAPEEIADLTLVSEQELLDAGLLACVDSARFSGTPIFIDSILCGAAFFPFGFLATGVGLVGLRMLHNRRRTRRFAG